MHADRSKVSEWRNVLCHDSTVAEIQRENAEKIGESRRRVHIPNRYVEHRLCLHPMLHRAVSEHAENIAPLFAAVMTRKQLECEHNQGLVDRYRHHMGRYREIQPKLDLLLLRVRTWNPDVYSKDPVKPDSPALMQYVVPDQPMLPPDKRVEMLFNDGNRLCENPALEHERFKRRVVWTEKEVRKFLEKFAEHPKQFRKIAKDLPGKTVKDLIEFYYLKKFELNLKEVGALAKRWGRMKVISEGMVKRTKP
jgi:hypothetical protein